jgi:ribose-phosphate pyrophosphokinase
MTTDNSPDLRVHSFPDSAQLGRKLARAIGAPHSRVGVHTFPDGETLIRVRPTGEGAAVLVHSLHDPDAKIPATLFAADALRRAGIERVTLVAPYLPYMRQDRVFHPGEPISQRVIGRIFRGAFDRVLTIEAHLHRVSRLAQVMGRGSRSISAAPAIARWIRNTGPSRPLVVGPDSESEPWVKAIADRAGASWIVGRKTRRSDRSVRIRLPAAPDCSRAVIVDDIASSGATLAEAARRLRQQGIEAVDAVVVHAVFAAGALDEIRAASIRRVVSCDTIPHPTNEIPTAGLLRPPLVGENH